MKRLSTGLVLSLACLLSSDLHGLRATEARTVAGAENKAGGQVSFAGLPVRFEENRGQVDPRVRYVARTGGGSVFLTDEGATIDIPVRRMRTPERRDREFRRAPHPVPGVAARPEPDTVLRLRVVGGRDAAPEASRLLTTQSNYFIGSDPARWRTHVPNFGRITYAGVKDGVDLVFHGEGGRLEYDFVVAPGGRVQDAEIAVDGAENLSLTAQGELRIETRSGEELVEPRPRVYQIGAGGAERKVEGNYRLRDGHVAFEVAQYDHARALVIDPFVMLYGTYLTGTDGVDSIAGEEGVDGAGYYGGPRLAVDASGEAYFIASTIATDFPVTSDAYDTSAPHPGYRNAFVAKLNANGTALAYATYLGATNSSSQTYGMGLALDSSGSAYVTVIVQGVNTAVPADYPTTSGAYIGPCPEERGYYACTGALTKLDPSGSSLSYSTFVDAFNDAVGYSVAVDSAGSAYVTGPTGASSVFVTTTGAFQNLDCSVNNCEYSSAFVEKFNAAGSGLDYSTYLGCPASPSGEPCGTLSDGIAVDGSGNAYVTGAVVGGGATPNFPTTSGAFQTAFAATATYDGNAFLSVLNPTGTALVYSTYLGGSVSDQATGVAVDASSNAYVTGWTESSDFPTTSGAYSSSLGSAASAAFVASFGATGTVRYSTLVGGGASYAIAADGSGNSYVTGTAGAGFPVTSGAIESDPVNGVGVFVAELNATGTGLNFATLLGGATGIGLALHSSGNVYVGGEATPSGSVGGALVTSGAFDSASPPGEAVWVAEMAPVTTVPLVVVSPSSISLEPAGTQTFSVSGGTGAGYVFSLSTNNSGATIDVTTGAYAAGSTGGGVTDTVLVTDSDGNTGTATVTVGASAASSSSGSSSGSGSSSSGGEDATTVEAPDGASAGSGSSSGSSSGGSSGSGGSSSGNGLEAGNDASGSSGSSGSTGSSGGSSSSGGPGSSGSSSGGGSSSGAGSDAGASPQDSGSLAEDAAVAEASSSSGSTGASGSDGAASMPAGGSSSGGVASTGSDSGNAEGDASAPAAEPKGSSGCGCAVPGSRAVPRSQGMALIGFGLMALGVRRRRSGKRANRGRSEWCSWLPSGGGTSTTTR